MIRAIRPSCSPDTRPRHLRNAISHQSGERGFLRRPTSTEMDRDDPSLRHALDRIVERDNRVLRVIYNETRKPVRIATVYFDRTQGIRL